MSKKLGDMIDALLEKSFTNGELLTGATEAIGEGCSRPMRKEMIKRVRANIHVVALQKGVTDEYVAFAMAKALVDRYFEILEDQIAAHGCSGEGVLEN